MLRYVAARAMGALADPPGETANSKSKQTTRTSVSLALRLFIYFIYSCRFGCVASEATSYFLFAHFSSVR